MTMTTIKVIEKIEEFLPNSKSWTKSAHARNKSGLGVAYNSREAVCFCLDGAFQNVRRQCDLPEDLVFEITQKLHDAVKPHYESYVYFNDAQETTFEDVRALLKRVKDKEILAQLFEALEMQLTADEWEKATQLSEIMILTDRPETLLLQKFIKREAKIRDAIKIAKEHGYG